MTTEMNVCSERAQLINNVIGAAVDYASPYATNEEEVVENAYSVIQEAIEHVLNKKSAVR